MGLVDAVLPGRLTNMPQTAICLIQTSGDRATRSRSAVGLEVHGALRFRAPPNKHWHTAFPRGGISRSLRTGCFALFVRFFWAFRCTAVLCFAVDGLRVFKQHQQSSQVHS